MECNDIVTKDFEAYPDVAADIINALVHGGRDIVKEQDLLSAPTETVYKGHSDRKNQYEDLAKFVFVDGEMTAVYLLANQTTVDNRMLLRKAGYVGGYYREQYDGKIPGLCPVMELILYWGKKRWNAPDCMGRLFQDSRMPREAWKYIDDIRLHVWELRRLPAQVRERFKSDMRIVLDYLAEGESYRTDRKVVHKEALINMLRVLSGDENLEETKVFMEEMNIREEDEITMCELFDQYVRQGKKQGIEQGIEQGKKQGIEQGKRQGIEQGKKQGIEQGQLMAAKNMMKELNLTAEQALRIAGIPKQKWSKYESRMA